MADNTIEIKIDLEVGTIQAYREVRILAMKKELAYEISENYEGSEYAILLQRHIDRLEKASITQMGRDLIQDVVYNYDQKMGCE